MENTKMTLDPLTELERILDRIDRYNSTDDAYKLEEMVRTAIAIIKDLPANNADEYFESGRNEVIEELKHTLGQEVKLFGLATTVKGKREELKLAKRHLTPSVRSYLSKINN